MQLSAPTRLVFLISLVLAVIGVLPTLGVVLPTIGALAGWALIAGYVLLALGVTMKGL